MQLSHYPHSSCSTSPDMGLTFVAGEANLEGRRHDALTQPQRGGYLLGQMPGHDADPVGKAVAVALHINHLRVAPVADPCEAGRGRRGGAELWARHGGREALPQTREELGHAGEALGQRNVTSESNAVGVSASWHELKRQKVL